MRKKKRNIVLQKISIYFSKCHSITGISSRNAMKFIYLKNKKTKKNNLHRTFLLRFDIIAVPTSILVVQK